MHPAGNANCTTKIKKKLCHPEVIRHLAREIRRGDILPIDQVGEPSQRARPATPRRDGQLARHVCDNDRNAASGAEQFTGRSSNPLRNLPGSLKASVQPVAHGISRVSRWKLLLAKELEALRAHRHAPGI
eukprot:3206897-Pyramimonas_sp.AAC.1